MLRLGPVGTCRRASGLRGVCCTPLSARSSGGNVGRNLLQRAPGCCTAANTTSNTAWKTRPSPTTRSGVPCMSTCPRQCTPPRLARRSRPCRRTLERPTTVGGPPPPLPPPPSTTRSPQHHRPLPPFAPQGRKNREGPEETGHGERDEPRRVTGQGRPRSPKTVQSAEGEQGKGKRERSIVVVRSPCQENYPADAHPSAHKSVLESASPARTRSVHLDAPGQQHGQQPVSRTADPGQGLG